MDQYQQKILHQKLSGISPPTTPLTIQHANQDFSSMQNSYTEYGYQATEQSSLMGDSLIQIYVPQNPINGGNNRKSSRDLERNNSGDDDDGDSDSTIEDKSVGLSALRDASNRHLEGSSLNRKVPPSLSDWQHRSQSFPSPATPAQTDDALAGILRKSSLPEKSMSTQNNNSKTNGSKDAGSGKRKSSRKRK